MNSKRQLTSYVLLLFGLLWLFYWLHVKAQLYWGLEYFGDLFLHVQISKSFYLGKGLFYDNVFAPASHIHNYFVLLLLAPFTFTFGGMGLPAAHLGILALAFWYAVTTFSKREHSKTGLGAFLLGPIGFWMFDDPAYGWHSELLFFPFSILLVCTLVNQSRWFYVVALLMALNREDGPILACAIHCIYLCSSFPFDRSLFVKLLKVVGGWVLVFIVGMIFLKVVGDGANDRQGKVIAMALRAWQDPDLFNGVMEMLWGSFLLLGTAIVFFLLRGGMKATGLALLFGAPVLAVCLFASFAYLPKLASLHGHGTSWPYRFGMLWSVVFAAFVFGPTTKLGRSQFIALFVLLLSVVGQVYALDSVRAYSFLNRIYSPSVNVTHLESDEKEFLSCLYNRLPPHSSVMTSGALTAYFAHLNWSYGENSKHAMYPAELIVCDGGRFHHDNGCREEWEQRSSESWNKREFKGLLLAFKKNNPKVNKVVRGCLRPDSAK